jgi:tetratricopeptide (TPR) repeat protein
MKRIIQLSLLLFFTLTTNAQDSFTKGMQKAFTQWGEGNANEAANLFERIATVEKDNWLPFYYVAQINTISAFGENDKEKLTQKLDKAQEYIDIATAIAPNEPEILVQQAMIHTAWVAFDGATYGMTLSGKVAALYQKALALAPDNPRVVYSKASWDMGSAQYFGKDTSPYCKDLAHALQLFANFKPESPFHPNWGKERAEAALQTCGNQ